MMIKNSSKYWFEIFSHYSAQALSLSLFFKMFPFWWFGDPHIEEHIPKKDRLKSTLTLYNHSGLPLLLHLTTNP